MSGFRFSRLSLLWKILLSTSVAITVLFAFTGWIVENNALTTTSRSLEDEVQASFQAYRSLLEARQKLLATVSRILSTMSDVRRAFGTGDRATIRDTAGELWSKVSEENALFLVTDPKGRLVASLGGEPEAAQWRELEVVPRAAGRFPKQASGFMLKDGHLYQVVVTPVQVQSGRDPRDLALLNVLVAGFVVDHLVAQSLKESTGGSEFLFLSQGRVIASTLNPRATAELARAVAARASQNAPARGSSRIEPVSDGVVQYAPLPTPLLDIEGRTIGELWIFRSFENAHLRLALLRREFVLLGLLAMLAGLGPCRHLQQHVRFHSECASGTHPPGANFHYRAPFELHCPRSAQSAGGHLRRLGNHGGFRDRSAATQAAGR